MNNVIPSLYKALQLVHELSKSNYTQAELSKNLNITMSTTYRILCTLMAEGWILKRADGRYMLGGGMLPLLSFFHRDIAHTAALRKIVEDVAKKTDLFAKLSIFDGNLHHVTLHRADPEEEGIRLINKAGMVFSLVDGPTGAALLLDRTPEQIRHICQSTTENTLAKEKPELMVAAVAECRKQGYLLRPIQNTRWEVIAMAMPVRIDGKVVAALTVLGAPDDFAGKKEEKIAEALKKFATACEKAVVER